MEEDLLKQISAKWVNKYYGKYRGFVFDNHDPERRGRLKLRVPSVLGEEPTGWALPCLPFGGLEKQGLFTIPEREAQVWVEFEEGDLCHPIWTGTFWRQPEEAPVALSSDEPSQRVLKTPAGHTLLFEDREGEERIVLEHPMGTRLEMDAEGSLTVTDAAGATLTLDAHTGQVVVADANGNNTLTLSEVGITVEDLNNNRIEMAPAGVTVNAQQVVVEGTQVLLGGSGGEPVIKGQSFLNLFATHVHTAPSGGGPTTPPRPQGEVTALSRKVSTA